MKTMSKNMLFSILARATTLITGLIVQRYILLAFGSSLNGLTSAITQVMSYLVLLEAGLGTASIQALYRPLQVDDWNEVSSVISATRKSYQRISLLFVILLVAAAALIPLMVAGEVDFVIAGLLTILTGGSYIASYIFGGKYKALLTADNKIYVLYTLDSISMILSCIFRIVALKNGAGIIFVQAINLVCVLYKNIGYVIYVKCKYNKIDYSHKADFSLIRKRWNVLIHQIAGIVVNHTDILILTAFSNLKLVSLYSVYNMVFSQLSTLIQGTFVQAPQGTFGREYNKGMECFRSAYRIYERFFTVVIFSISTISIIMILPFITIYTSGVSDINYISNILPILFTGILLMNQIRTPAVIAINVSGAFKETQTGAMLEAAINLCISLVLYFFTPLGIYGLLIGTVASYIYRTTDVLIYVYNKILHESIWPYLKVVVIDMCILMCTYIVFVLVRPIHVSSMPEWMIAAAIVSIAVGTIYIGINAIMDKVFRSAMLIYLQKFMRRMGKAK